MCVETLKAINAACGGGNKGGLKQILYVAYADAVATIPAPAAGTHVISDDITMRAADAGATPPVAAGLFYRWQISQFDDSYDAEQLGDIENVAFNHKVMARINKLTADKNHTFQGLLGRPVICIWKDGNGTQWLLGSKDEPAYIRIKPESGDKNGYVIELAQETGDMLYEYTGAIPV